VIRLVSIDDHALFRAGLRKVVSDESDMSLVADAGDWDEGWRAILRHVPDVLLLDINLPGRSGLDLIAPVTDGCPSVRVVMLSMYAAPSYALRARQAGAWGYVSKDLEVQVLLGAIRLVAAGQRFVSPKALVPSAAPAGPDAPHFQLSARESQILMQLIHGKQLTQIAAQMAISVKTVSTYRHRILAKLAARSNAELVHYAVRHHLLH